MKKYFLLLSLALMAVFTANAQQAPQNEIIVKGQQAPGFSFTTDQGVSSSLSDYKDHVVLVTFFATWCPYCRQELPELQKQVWDKYKNNPDFKLLVIGRGQTMPILESFKHKNGYTFPIVSDSTKSIYNMYAKQYIPRNFLIGKDGKVVLSTTGYSVDKFGELTKDLETLLNK